MNAHLFNLKRTSIAALAYATGDTVTFHVDNAPSTVCSAVPGWFIANTRYFVVSK